MENNLTPEQENQHGRFLKKDAQTAPSTVAGLPLPQAADQPEVPAAEAIPAPVSTPEAHEIIPESVSVSDPVSEQAESSQEIPSHPALSVPDALPDISIDENAVAFQGMTHPTDPDVPFDLSILDDLDLNITEDQASEEALVPADTSEPAPSADAVPAETEIKEPPVRKVRPKRKKGEGFWGIPNILSTMVWLALALLIGVTMGRMLWVCASDVLAFGRPDQYVSVTIYESDTIETITQKLYSAGLIRYPKLFKFYADFAVDEGEIHPGIWDLNTKYDYHALVKMMSPSSSREVIKVMIPEGYSCRQIFALLEENKVCTAKDLESYAANGELTDFWFLENVQRGDKYCLEGFLFPDTYEFYKNDSPRSVLNKMLGNFDTRFDESLRWEIDQLNSRLTDWMRASGKDDAYIASHLFTIHEIVIVASMVEKETATVDEGYMVSSVIYNRLFRWGATPPYLNIDATIIYALDGKTNLTLDDLKVDSPYNTYLNTGLTPGPISNPGLASLKAALIPADSDFYFYVLDPAQGTHHFSRTQEEHDAFRATLGG